MRITITNGCLTAEVDTYGAELKQLRNEETGIDHLWGGDPSIWADTAPFLFPVVARQLHDRYTLDGETYTMPMHGFAKDSEFTVLEQTNTSLTLLLTENETTRKWYPFSFRLTATFTLEGSKLQIVHTVTNTGKRDMPFSLGEHPGYRIPMLEGECMEDYYLRFSDEENAERWYLDDEIICGSEPGLNGDTLHITKNLFDRGALIFKNLRSHSISLRSRNHAHSVTVSLDDWEYLGIWAKPAAPYVCIEPWNGLASSKWSDCDIWNKEGIRRLTAGETETFSMSIALT